MNNDLPAHLLPLDLDRALGNSVPLFCRIADWGLLQVTGADAEKFLQGQVTCDMRRLGEQGYLGGAFCNPKGRVLATFQLFASGGAIYLRMPRDLISHMQSHLQRYAAFFDVRVDYAHELIGLAIFGNSAARLTAADMLGGAFQQEMTECWGTPDQVQNLEKHLLSELPQGSPDWWDAHLIRNGSAQIVSLTSEHFLPHQLSMDLSGAVSFRKGCYTGQEIVARTQYRGKSKKRLAAARLHHRENFYPGTEIIGLDNQPIGHMLMSVSDAAGTLIQAILPDDLATQGELVLGNHKTPYELVRLPFQEYPEA